MVEGGAVGMLGHDVVDEVIEPGGKLRSMRQL